MELIEKKKRVSALKNQVDLYAQIGGKTHKLGTHEEYIEPLRTIGALLKWIFPRKVSFYRNEELVKEVRTRFFQSAGDLITKEDARKLFGGESSMADLGREDEDG